MGAKKALVLVLAIVLVAMAVSVVACGGNDAAAKAALGTALAKVNQDVTALTAKFTSGGTVADVKAAKASFQSDWQAVIDAAGKVKGADVKAATDAWTAVSAAIDKMDESKPLLSEGPAILAPVQALTKVAADLAKLAGTSK